MPCSIRVDMYFSKGLSMKEVAESLGYKTAAPIRRIFAE